MCDSWFLSTRSVRPNVAASELSVFMQQSKSQVAENIINTNKISLNLKVIRQPTAGDEELQFSRETRVLDRLDADILNKCPLVTLTTSSHALLSLLNPWKQRFFGAYC